MQQDVIAHRRFLSFGHSTLELEPFVQRLSAESCSLAVDIRRYPASRRYPHFHKAVLEKRLPSAGIQYLHLEALGGRRRPEPDSPNGLWRNESFQGYADYMRSDEFREALAALEKSVSTTVFFCSESLWWRCHRRLVADELLRRGHEVRHMLPDGSNVPHVLTSGAVLAEDGIVYPPTQQRLTTF